MATIFSTVLLGVMTDISMELINNLWVGKTAGDVIGNIIIGKGADGVMQTVTQQLGVGLILSTLLITVPPMAGAWFNGLMGQYSGWNTMSGWNGGTPQSAPPGIAGSAAYQQQVEDKIHHQYKQLGQTYEAHQTSNTVTNPFVTKGMSSTVPHQSEAVKQNSQLGNAVSPSTTNTTAQIAQQNIGTDKSKPKKGEES